MFASSRTYRSVRRRAVRAEKCSISPAARFARLFAVSLLFVGQLAFTVSTAAAETVVRKAFVRDGKLVLEVIERPSSTATVEVQLGGQKIEVPVSGLVPNRSRSVTTKIEVPCGDHQVQARAASSSERFSGRLTHDCSDSSPFGGTPSGSGGSRNDQPAIEFSDLQANSINGRLGVQVRANETLPRGPIQVEFSYENFREIGQLRSLSRNRTAKINGKQPFPCNKKLQVKLKVLSPASHRDTSYAEDVFRRCSRTQGTPNLVPASLERNDRIQTNATADSKVALKIVVRNDSEFDMPFNEQGQPWWFVKVPGVSERMEVRRPLKAGESYTLKVDAAVACYTNPNDRFRELTVTVDSSRRILEEDENDNAATFRIEANRCRDAG